jgi:hypothetical protein
MIQKMKLMLLSLSSLIAFVAPAVVTATVSAQGPITPQSITGATCSGTSGDLAGTDTTACDQQNQSTFNKYASLIINLLSVIIGFVAVVMILLGGFRYITSGGNSENVGKAKNTILYGIIGLVIVALAQIIVQFVLNKTANPATSG